MASCDHPEDRVDPMCDDGDDSNASGDEVQTPISRNKNKRKETDEGGSSKKARSWNLNLALGMSEEMAMVVESRDLES
ncbi:hypothetical protein F2Q69_00046696 [Brassica cretica]|uniref:Uncharacterized protein n=1 Tax=Brassica cretica TaxID=69181 RepID=A0A8S9PTA9_BRACR|nr:hypothetical protein F2Q69_00046696 [Brassica cretica]